MNESERLLRDGIAALKAGQRSEARQLLAEAVKADPKSEWGWIYLAALLPPAQAITALERAVKINPQNPQAQQGLLALRNQPSVEMVEENKPLRAGLAGRVQRAGERSDSLSKVEDSSQTLATPPEDLRDLLSQPTYQDPSAKRTALWPVFLSLGLVVVALGALVAAYFLIVNKPEAPVPARPQVVETVAATTTAVATTQTTVTTAAAITAFTPAAATEAAITTVPVSVSGLTSENKPTLTPTLLPAPTPATPTNLRIAQNQRAELRGYNLLFSSYDNRSGNFSASGAGSPRAGRHFEGVLVQLENRFNRTLASLPENFQALDGRNNYVPPMAGGRLPSLDVNRLQPGEIRLAWLTFEVEDGTTLRRIVFTGPNTGPDAGSTVEVNLILPAATPAPTRAPTKVPTAIPTSTPVPPTPRPTSTPAPTETATPVPGNNVPIVATVSVTAEALVATPIPTATSTAAAVPTVTPEPPTATPAPPTPTASNEPPTATPAPRAEMKQRYVLGDTALTVSQYVKEPLVKPSSLPSGYHYEAVKVTLEDLGEASPEFSNFIGTYPFYLRDGENRVYTVGPLMADGPERFDPTKFSSSAASGNATPTKKAATKSVSGLLYFLVRDGAKANRTLVFYNSKELDSNRVEIALK